MKILLHALIGLLCLTLCGCQIFITGKPRDPIPTVLIPPRVPAPNGRLVIVLPGRADNLEALRASGITEAIQDGDPTAEVILVAATMPYYMDGGIVRRLHEQIIAPAQSRGQRNIWIAGASMGGMGALLYEREHPGEVAGLLLMAPYLGDKALVAEIADAGGPQLWQPPAERPTNARDVITQKEWQLIKTWNQRPDIVERVWLVCGVEDRFNPAARLVAPLLPSGHFLERAGGHAWKVWTAGASDVFKRLGNQSAQGAAMK